jgi:hypothetical protein
MYSRVGIRQHVLRESAIVFESSHLPSLAEARIKAVCSPLVLLASYAASTSSLEVQNTDAVSNLPCSYSFDTNLSDFASWLMRRNDGKGCTIELTMQYLEV